MLLFVQVLLFLSLHVECTLYLVLFVISVWREMLAVLLCNFKMSLNKGNNFT